MLDHFFNNMSFVEGITLLLIIALFSEKLKPCANFILRLCGRKVINGSDWLTKEDYNNRRPEWFDAWEKRHDETHEKIGSSIKDVANELKETRKEIGGMSQTVARIDERTKKD